MRTAAGHPGLHQRGAPDPRRRPHPGHRPDAGAGHRRHPGPRDRPPAAAIPVRPAGIPRQLRPDGIHRRRHRRSQRRTRRPVGDLGRRRHDRRAHRPVPAGRRRPRHAPRAERR